MGNLRQKYTDEEWDELQSNISHNDLNLNIPSRQQEKIKQIGKLFDKKYPNTLYKLEYSYRKKDQEGFHNEEIYIVCKHMHQLYKSIDEYEQYCFTKGRTHVLMMDIEQIKQKHVYGI